MKKTKITAFFRRAFNLKNILFLVVIIVIVAGGGFFYKNYKFQKEYYTYDKANEFFYNGDKQSGIKILERVLKRNPNDARVAESLAIFYYSNSQYDDFAQIVKKYNLSSDVIENLLASLAASQDDEAEVIKIFESLIKTSNNPNYYINYATYYLARGDLDKASEIASSGVQNNPSSSKMNIFAASVCLKKADRLCAKKYAQAALAQDANDTQAQAILQGL